VIQGTASKLGDALRDRYVVERELGRGGMATVYLARDLKHGRHVALKVLHPELAATLGPERFQREIETVARLQHPHILTVHDSGETAGQLWFTMPFVEGESLRDRLRREQQLSVEVALRIATDAARALQYAHEHGVIHRDIKPENLLLTKDGSTLVADFGIARALSGGDDRLTETGISVGTPAYMSPEQAAGERTLDARTDVYALGAVLYEMLAGEPPFTGPTAQAVIAKRFHSEAIPLRTVRPSVPSHVERAVTRALARVTTDRFASTAELARALHEDPSLATIPAAVRPTPRVRSVPTGLLLLGLGILIGLGVLFAWTRDRRGETAGEPGLRRVAVLPFENLGEPDKAYFADGITDEIRGKLATVAGLQVSARTSSAQYAHTTKPPQEIGHELGVDYLLTGTVRWDKEGSRSRVRVSPELVQAASGVSHWQQSFDAPLTDLFHVQADVSERVARELGVALAAGQRRHMQESPTGDLGAYDLYLRGRYAWHQRTAAGLDQARRLLEQAIALDPAFAPAHAALADVYTVLPLWSDLPPDQTYPRAKAAALAALKLDSTLAAPFAALGDVNAMYEWDWAAADRNFRQSLALDPNNANTHHWYNGDYLVPVGRLREALAEAGRARELDPLSVLINVAYGQTLYRAGRLEEAAAQLRGVMALDSSFIIANEFLGTVYLFQGRAAEAVPLLERAIDPTVRHSVNVALLAYAYAKAGRRREAEALLRELLERRSKGYVSPASIALLTAGLGDTAETFAWLRRAVEIHDPLLVYNFVNEPMLEPFRRDPRGVEILRAMRLPKTR
jgi:TolB-like protein/Tfp pilus assembly protein PilF/tRNA A-37 threonylcarbamoyl transferase component Bud32